MDPATAINSAQNIIQKANLPPDLQQTAFAEVLRYFLAEPDASPGTAQPAGGPGQTAGSAPAAGPTGGWSQVTNTADPPVTDPAVPS